MKTRNDILHSCFDCMHSYTSGISPYCSLYPKHISITSFDFCGQWSHNNNYEREYNQSKNQLTVT